MLNQRQLEIVLELCEKPNVYMTAAYFARKQQVSLRTVQNDIRQIKLELDHAEYISFESTARKGCRILVSDMDQMPMIKEYYYRQFSSVSVNYQNERIDQILLLLLRQHRAISLYDIETSIFVSHSTLANDLKRVSDVLKKYNLELLRSSNKVVIDGSEINKRLCMLEQNLILSADIIFAPTASNDNTLEKVKNILVDTLVEFQRPVTEAALKNLIVQVYVALKRMQDWFFISPDDLQVTEQFEPEWKIAQAVFKRISREFLIRIPDTELLYLALYMRGQGNFASGDLISHEVDDLVLAALTEIRDLHGIDLTDNLKLRIALALHTAPLIIRLKYDMQLDNHLVGYIRQNFPHGFDLGIYFAAYLQKVFNKRVHDDETAFLAIHLYNALVEQQRAQGTKRILVISSMRQSENILLRQTLLNWLSNEIAELAFVTPDQIKEEHMDLYDIFLTTEKGSYYDMGLAFYINPFPNRQDHMNLKLAIDGFRSIDDITSIFPEELFFIQNGESRETILRKMTKHAAAYFQIKENALEDAVLQREQLGSTFFGNGIAAPHPIAAVSSDSFVAVTELPQAVEWDEEKNMVRLVLMVCIGKNNTKAFQLWNYLSKVFADQTFVERLLPDPGYEHFISLLKETIADNFQN